jgi:hypothetical protein
MPESRIMARTIPFATFYLDVTGEHAEEQIVHALALDGMITFDTIQSIEDCFTCVPGWERL